MSRSSSDAARLRLLRETLTATGAGIYLATHVAGPLPAETLAAVHQSDDLELRLGRAGPDRSVDQALREGEARAALAAVIGAPIDEVALAHGAADAARAAALACLALHAGRGRILVVEGVGGPVREAMRSISTGGHLALEDVASPPDILAPDVALLVMAHVGPSGERADPGRVAAAARRVGARLVVDASLSVGAVPMRVAELGVDAVVADVHRWLLGPEGVALIWVSPGLGEGSAGRVAAATVGTFGRGMLLATARSAGWLLMYVGLPWVVERTMELAARLRAGLAAIEGVEVIGEAARGSAMLAFRIAGWPAEDAAAELSHRVHAITDPEPDSELHRVSVGAWNSEAELDRFVAGVAELAAARPGSLPRRPPLTVIGGPLGDVTE